MQPLRGAGLEDRAPGGGRRRAPAVNNFFGNSVNFDEEAELPQMARGGGVGFGSDAAGSAAPIDAADAVTSFQAVSPPARGGRPGTVRPAPSVNNFFAEGDLPIMADDEGAPGLSPDPRSLKGRHAAGRRNKVAPAETITSVTPGLTEPQRPPLKRKRERRVGGCCSICCTRVLCATLVLVLITALALGIVFLLTGRALHVLPVQAV